MKQYLYGLRRRTKLIAVAGLFAIIGYSLTLLSSASVNNASFEAEAGTLAGQASQIADPGTSGGASVRFGSSGTSTGTGTAVSTYQSIGLYWNPPAGSATNAARVEYRKAGQTDWKQGRNLWYDLRAIGDRPPEYRGSIVMLEAGTTYEVKVTLASGPTTTLTTTTWTDPERLPIARTVTVPSGGSYTIPANGGGTASGYVLYTAAPGSTITASTVKTDNQMA